MPHSVTNRIRMASVALIAAACAPALSSLPVSAAASSSRVMEFSSSSGAWSATSTRVDAASVADPTPLSIIGTTVLFGVSDAGHLTQSAPDPQRGSSWTITDLTESAAVPTVKGSVAVVIDRANRIVLFARSTSDHLLRVRSGSGAGGWSTTDMTQDLGAPSITSSPSAAIGARGGISVFWRSSTGHLIGALQHRRLVNRWEVRDLTKATGSPTVAGTPSAVSTRVDGASVTVATKTFDGRLFVLADDNAKLTVWTAYDLTGQTRTGTVSSSPTAAFTSGRLAVTAVRDDGSLLVVSAPRAGSQRFVAADLTAGAGTGTIKRDQPSVALDAGRMLVAARNADKHLLVFSADPATSFLSVSATDVTANGGGISITSAPVISTRAGGPAVFASRYLPPPPPPPPPPPSSLATTIVSIAKGQDQTAAKVAEVPMGTNCNPYTGHFGRGDPSGCPAGSSAEAWCSDFANWVWQQAGAQIGGLTGWSYTFANYGRAHGTWKLGATNNPQPGDAIIFGDESQHYGSHVGIVVAVRDGQIKMTSGNWANAVITTGFFDPAGDTGAGYPIIGYSSPVAVGGASAKLLAPKAALPSMSPTITLDMINSQDQGR